MPKGLKKDDLSVILNFGGGVHSRATEEDIDIRECSDGQNFELDAQNMEYRPRKAFDKLGTATNAAEIRGFANLIKSDGTVSILVQAGATVYALTGAALNTFTSKGTVAATARLRGRIEHNWQLANKVLITDLALLEEVREWDGTTFQAVTFANSNPPEFRAKYCLVSKERAFFANVWETIAIPHMIVGSERGDYTTITVSDRPSSALSEADPFYLLQPDLRPINGMVESFGKVITSSDNNGSMFVLTGESAQEFYFDELFPRSGASGEESVTYVGNDIFYGRHGRIESVAASDKFGDVEQNDLSNDISDKIIDLKNWTSVYNSRTQRVFFFPDNSSDAWVYHKPLSSVGSDGVPLSPWIKYKTIHATDFQPTAIMNMIDPNDGLEYIFFGDSTGNVYRMEGTGLSDGGTASIRTERLSKLVIAPLNAKVYNVQGWVKWRSITQATTLILRFEYAGENVFNEEITITLPATSNINYFGGGGYFGGDLYFGSKFTGRLTRRKFAVVGQANEFQIRATVISTSRFRINQIGLQFEASA